mmetsp:Transcript_17950/g.38251  ORF Transcript_17950/g.38251 Transcript_17950/m.38251 type:complete len:320 (-) Transcript_17950:701-1660(-)
MSQGSGLAAMRRWTCAPPPRIASSGPPMTAAEAFGGGRSRRRMLFVMDKPKPSSWTISRGSSSTTPMVAPPARSRVAGRLLARQRHLPSRTKSCLAAADGVPLRRGVPMRRATSLVPRMAPSPPCPKVSGAAKAALLEEEGRRPRARRRRAAKVRVARLQPKLMSTLARSLPLLAKQTPCARMAAASRRCSTCARFSAPIATLRKPSATSSWTTTSTGVRTRTAWSRARTRRSGSVSQRCLAGTPCVALPAFTREASAAALWNSRPWTTVRSMSAGTASLWPPLMFRPCFVDGRALRMRSGVPPPWRTSWRSTGFSRTR